MRRFVIVKDKFAEEATDLRAHFDERFANPRAANADRFVWDFWHVPGQYTLLRTPAYHYFPAPLYRSFHERLVWWGRRTLGCHDISPPWLSNYVAGCSQELHGDLPHGQWAFVFSLTPWQARTFTGGETLLLREEVLDFWRDFTSHRGLEERELIEEIEPRFNRLTVFDPRIPHGVRRVEGTMDPRAGRLVIHGWFVQPRPFIEGPISEEQLDKQIEGLTEELGNELASNGPEPVGLVSLKLDVTPDGRVSKTRVLCDTTRVANHDEARRAELVRWLLRRTRQFRFSKRKKASQITLPLVFER